MEHTVLKTAKKLLLVCGILSSLFYAATDIIACIIWESYSYTSQTVSELIAVNAPTRPPVVLLFTVYALLIYAFGAGIWLSAEKKSPLRTAALLIVCKEVLGLAITLFFPIHLRGVRGNLSDIMHGILTGIGVLFCMFPAMGFGATSFGKKFRTYSVVTMLIFLLFGIITGFYQPKLAADQPTPWMGIFERINIYGYMLWIIVLAVVLLQTGKVNNSDK